MSVYFMLIYVFLHIHVRHTADIYVIYMPKYKMTLYDP